MEHTATFSACIFITAFCLTGYFSLQGCCKFKFSRMYFRMSGYKFNYHTPICALRVLLSEMLCVSSDTDLPTIRRNSLAPLSGYNPQFFTLNVRKRRSGGTVCCNLQGPVYLQCITLKIAPQRWRRQVLRNIDTFLVDYKA